MNKLFLATAMIFSVSSLPASSRALCSTGGIP